MLSALALLLLDLVVVAVHDPAPDPEAASQEEADERSWASSVAGRAALAAPLADEPEPAEAPAPAPAPTTTAPPAPPPPPARPGAWTLEPYRGTGVWIDVYDWTLELTGGNPKVGPAEVEHMADLGIQTVFIQTAHRRSAADIIEPDRLLALIDTAHARGMAVVGWYLPMLEDVHTDFRRLMAATTLPIDGLGVDIESLAIGDPGLRTHLLLTLSNALRDALGDRAMSAITPSAVHLQVVNPSFWPGFPWPELGATYDVIVPMSYWSVRRPEWRAGERYVAENIDRIRAVTRPDMPIHVAGGIADQATLDDVAGMVRAIQSRGILGGSLYDWNTSHPGQWDLLRLLRVEPAG